MKIRFLKVWGMAPAILIFMIFPLTFSFAKLGFNYGPPILFVALRMIFAGLVLVAYELYTQGFPDHFTLEEWKLFFRASVLGITVGYVAFNWALKHMSVASASMILLMGPFFSTLLEHYYNLSVITRKKLIGLVIGVIGLLPILLQKTALEQSFEISKYELCALLYSLSYSYGWISVKEMLNKRRHSAVYINGLRLFVGGILAVVASYFLETWDGLNPDVSSWSNYLWYILVVSLVALICYALYGFLLHYYSAGMISFCGFTEPLFAVLYAWLLLGETVTSVFFLSLSVIAIGLYLFYQEELRLGS